MIMHPDQQPARPERTAGADPFTRRMIVEGVRDLAEKITVAPLLDLQSLELSARTQKLVLPAEDPARATPIEAIRSVSFLNKQVLIPGGEFATIAVLGARAILVEGKFDPNAVTSEDYLGSQLHLAPITWVSMIPNCPGLVHSNWAFFDPGASRRHASLLAEKVSPLTPDSPLAQEISRQLRERNLPVAKYEELCGHDRIRSCVAAEAQNHILFSSFGLPDVRAENSQEVVKLLTRSSSTLREVFAEAQAAEDWKERFMADSILRYCSSLRGILRDLKDLAAQERYPDMRLTALEFLCVEHLRSRIPEKQATIEALNQKSAAFLVSGCQALGMESEGDLLNAIGGADRKIEDRALRLFQSLYDLDFRSEDSRAAVIANPQSLR